MPDATVKRTLVKSPPELWAEISDVASLARHLGEFGDISITRAEPETTVAWEGDRVRGTVELEASGWGTKVTLTAEAREVAAAPVAEPVPAVAAPAPVVEAPVPVVEAVPVPEAVEVREPAVAPEPESGPARKPGFFARMFGRKATTPEPTAAERAAQRAAARMPAAPTPSAPPAPVIMPVAEAPEPAPAPVIPLPIPAPADADEPLPAAVSTPAAPSPERTQEILATVLDDLGAAHHRPFSRS